MLGDLQLTAADREAKRAREREATELISRRNYRLGRRNFNPERKRSGLK